MTDETTPLPPERSWGPEPTEPTEPAEPAVPAWAEPPAVAEDSAEDEYDAWLDAQDAPLDGEEQPEPDTFVQLDTAPLAAEPMAAEPVDAEPGDALPAETQPAAPEPASQEQAQAVEAPVVVPDALEAAATPLEVTGLEATEPETPEAQPATEEPAVQAPAVEEAVEEPAAVEPDLVGAVAAAPEPAGLDVLPAAEPVAEATPEPDEEPVAEPAPQQVAEEPAPQQVAEEPEPETAWDAAPYAADDEPEQDLEDEPAVAVGDIEDEASAPTRSGGALVLSLALVVAVLAGLTAFLGVQTSRTSGGGATEDARRDALAASREAARLVFSYDYRHLQKDFAAGKAVTTGKFASDYERTTSKLVDDVAARYKAVVVADVSDAAVVSASRSRVETLVFLSQTSSSTLATGQKITQSRVAMVLVHKGGRWLVSEVTAF